MYTILSYSHYKELFTEHDNFLFTEEEFDNARYKSKCLAVRCRTCGEVFYVSKQRLARFVASKHDKIDYCSNECYSKGTKITLTCFECGKQFTMRQYDYKRALARNKEGHHFCSHACANKHINSTVDRKKTNAHLKNKTHKETYKEKGFSSHAQYRYWKKKLGFEDSDNITYKDIQEKSKFKGLVSSKIPDSGKQSTIVHKICGLTPNDSNCNYCKYKPCKSRFFVQTSNIEKMGFDVSKIGTPEIFDEIDQLRDTLMHDYQTNGLTTLGVAQKYGIKAHRTIELLLYFFKVLERHEDVEMLNGTRVDTRRLKSGFHTSWEGNTYRYRSSYELTYMKYLDENKIKYVYEGLIVPYFDTQKNKMRKSFTDFYLEEQNLIVEIKSIAFYNKQNQEDRVKAYKELGYKYKLILEGIEYDYCP